ncbi:hypothetical protein QWY84_09945 [Aquisalimonas lutea]|uniref:hypothetical protein n=1 Tax=Aquisalimonas lutea TaxID=1327750 RepID=UPI0025B583D7|nr:hypothetical protein [Aquisalimonas lutea]MDN3517932.1 hypothetical protein [Aquisalimonas lutea]
MTPFATLFAAIAALLLLSLIAVLTWSVGREQQHERQLREKDADYAEALRRQGELRAETERLRGEQVRSAQRAKRMEEHFRRRGELIRELGLDPGRLEQGYDSLHGVTAISRIRIGILLAATLHRTSLEEVAATAGGRTERVFQQMTGRLARGDNGYQQDQQARDLLTRIIDDHTIERPVAPPAGDDEYVE